MSREGKEEKRINELLERSRRTREGRIADLWDYVIHTDPDMFEAYQNVYEEGLSEGRHLPAKYRELIAMAVLAYRGLREGVISHGRRAYVLGATKGEMLDAAKTVLVPGGAPTFGAYLAAVQAIDEEEKTAKK